MQLGGERLRLHTDGDRSDLRGGKFYLAEDLVRAPLAIHNGLVALPGKPGVGVEIDEAAVARLRVG